MGFVFGSFVLPITLSLPKGELNSNGAGGVAELRGVVAVITTKFERSRQVV
jgi:hypothetical protein